MAHDVDTPLITVTGDIARIKFDGEHERKLKPTHGYVSKALAAMGELMKREVTVLDLAMDAFNGHRFLIWALIAPTLKANQQFTPDDASALIDSFLKKGGKSIELRNAFMVILGDWLHIEVVNQDEDEAEQKKASEDDDPNSLTPATSGASAQ